MARGRKPKGLGDVIETITETTGIKAAVKAIAGDDCGCEERKEKLNKLFPFNRKIRNCITPEDKIYVEMFLALKTNTIYPIQQEELIRIYKNVFDVKIDYTTCSSCWRDYIADLKRACENS